MQSILLNSKLPTFYLSDFVKLPDKVFGKSYDILLTSNIFDWLYKDFEVESIKNYKELLEKFSCFEIQALYCWNDLNNDIKLELLRCGFDIDMISSAREYSLIDKNFVVSLRKYK